MADEQSTTAEETVETTAPEATEVTETNDSQDESVDAETSLEEVEVSPEDLGDETSKDEKDEESEEAQDEEEETEAEETTEDEPVEGQEKEESEEVEQSDEDKQKAFKREMYERRQLEKQQRELNIKQQQDKYLQEAQDEQDLALRQLQIDAYANKTEANANKLTNGYERAIKDFDVLRDATPEIQARIDRAVDAFQAQYTTVDAYGNVTDVRGDLYQYLQEEADSIKQLTGIGARQQQKNKAKEKSKTMITPSRTPKEPKVDPDMEAFDEEAYRRY